MNLPPCARCIALLIGRIYRTLVLALLVALASPSESVLVAVSAAPVPLYDFQLVPKSPKQGETLAVYLGTPSGATPPVVTFNKKTYKLYPGEHEHNGPVKYRALIGVPADLKPGVHPLTAGDTEQEVHVLPGGFTVQRIRMPKEKDNFIESPGEGESVDRAKQTATEMQLWTGLFQQPSEARVTARFGLRRMVNGHLLSDYFHSGLDFAGALGSPVYASQRGRVILAHTGWRLHGNTVAIDHGQGVVSFYIHLNKILVKAGQMVDSGQVIGQVGATGRATGPHLHFSLYVNGDATDPCAWFKRAM